MLELRKKPTMQARAANERVPPPPPQNCAGAQYTRSRKTGIVPSWRASFRNLLGSSPHICSF
ncbi:MAG: hypothetical protein BWY06_03119 [Candidatus Latescibacteria bacterium ADurb.Bin168]|nr:MAG: hypothetical protein BWY06_03119 [Candidatus Latescibacteria bacterium ADurb.Bin168]